MRVIFLIILCLFLLPEKVNAHPGIGIVMDSHGNVFYTDLVHVWKITKDGRRTIAVRDVHTHELFMDAADNLYGEHEWYEGEATDKWGNYVWRLTSDGKFEKIIEDVEGFLDNTTLLRDLDSNTYWTSKQEKGEIINKQDKDGQCSILTEHLFDDIRWMYFSKEDQSLYVVDRLKVKKISSAGHVEIIAQNLKDNKPAFAGVADHHYVYGLCTDNNQNLYIALFGASSVVKIDSHGRRSTFYQSEQDWSPCGILIAPDDVKWIMEFSVRNETRVRRIDPDGNHTIFGNH